MPHPSRLSRIYDRFVDALAAAAGAMLCGMSLWISAEVLLRYVFRSPTVWAIDLSEYTLLGAAFLGGPWVLRRNGHVRITLLVDMVKPSVQRVFGVGTSILGAAACCLMTWQIGSRSYEYFNRGIMFVKGWVVPQSPIYAIVAFSCALMAIEFLRKAVKYAGARDGEAGVHPKPTAEDWNSLGGERF